MRRYAQTALLLLLGGLLLKLALTGTYARYVTPTHLVFLVLAALALLTIGGVTLWRDVQAFARPDDEDVTAPMRLGGLFTTAVLSAPDRGSGLTGDVPTVGAETPSTSAATGEISTVDSRERAVAAGLAAAAHEGFDDSGRKPEDASESWLSTGLSRVEGLLRADAPTAAYDAVSPPPADPFDARSDPRLRPPDARAPDRPGPGRTRGAPAVGPVGGAGTRGGWALLAFSLAVLVLAPPALGAYPAAAAGTITVNAGADLPGIAAADPAPMSLVDYAAHALAGGQELSGRQVRLVGFVLVGPLGEPYLTRLVVGCCAAGARPVKVGLTGDLSGVLTAGVWVTVIGTYTDRTDPDPVNGAPIPYVSVLEVTRTDAPANPYES